MNEKSCTKPNDLDYVFTAEMFEDLNNTIDGINKRTLTASSYQYLDGRIMRVYYSQDNSLHIELYK